MSYIAGMFLMNMEEEVREGLSTRLWWLSIQYRSSEAFSRWEQTTTFFFFLILWKRIISDCRAIKPKVIVLKLEKKCNG